MRAADDHAMNDATATLPHGTPPARRLTRRRFLWSLLGGAVGVAGYTALIEPFWTETVHREMPFPRLPVALRGLRLVQLSDLHISHRVSETFLLRSFARVEALRPDIVVYTGDFLTLGPETRDRLARTFPRLPKGRRATFGILGNHDYGEGWSNSAWADEVVRLATASGIRILRNEAVRIDGLQLVGLDDLWAGRADPARGLARADLSQPTVVLSHNPDSVDVGDWRGYQGWVLAGHTHGGQCKPPFLPAPLLPVRNRRYTAGVIPLADGRTLYINRGLGYLHQVRFNVRPEITVFTLQGS
jgi:predicted MPP superfamily phosphohydrolase